MKETTFYISYIDVNKEGRTCIGYIYANISVNPLSSPEAFNRVVDEIKKSNGYKYITILNILKIGKAREKKEETK